MTLGDLVAITVEGAISKPNSALVTHGEQFDLNSNFHFFFLLFRKFGHGTVFRTLWRFISKD